MLSEFEQQVQEEIEFRDLRYSEIKNEKSSQEKQHFNLFRNLENNQFRAVQELEALYERKILIENERYIQLEQVLIEERQKFKQNMKELENDCSKQINEIKQKFQSDLKLLYDSIVANKSDIKSLQTTFQSTIQEEELYEDYIESIKKKCQEQIEEYKQELKKKDKQISIFQSSKLNQKEFELLKCQMQQEIQKQKDLDKHIFELLNQNKELQERIAQFESESAHCNEQIKEYQKYINGLQKSKLVLSYKTYEMQTEMEPKDKKIKELLESIPKLEEEVHSLQCEKKINEEKEKKISNQLKAQSEELEKFRIKSKKYQDQYKQVTMDLYNCYHEKKEKEWPDVIKSMYQKYIMKSQKSNLKNNENSNEQDKKTENQIKLFTRDITTLVHEYRESDWAQQLKSLYSKYFTGEMTMEISRQNQFLEKSSLENGRKFEKMLLRRDKEIYIKTNENQYLLGHLNQVLTQKNKLEKELADKSSKFESLLKAHARLQSQQQKDSNRNAQQFENNILLQEDSNLQQLNRSVGFNADIIPSQAQRKGRLVKGQNYNKQTLIRFDQHRNSDLMTQVEMAESRNQSLEQQVKTMRQKLIDAGIDEEMTQTNTQRPFSQRVGKRF